ncbi:MAG: DUF4139 domain-containing protein [Pseudomonadota bacterium]|nr:DUF4139 domain-containing protein [Pseudomonadota bacterium]
MQRCLLVAALSASAACAGSSGNALPTHASGNANAALTIYHADDDSLFSGDAQGNVDAGRAVVHEQRQVDVQSGRHTLRIGGLPASIDPEAVTVGFGNGAQVLGRRIVLARGNADNALAGHIGEHVSVTGSSGATIADGTLLAADGNGLSVRGNDGRVLVVHDYAAVALQPGAVNGGGSVLLDIDAQSSGARDAQLTYGTSGIGWRAAYSATLTGGESCKMHFDPLASIANRSGRDYDGANVKLVAGQPNLAGGTPRMFAAKAMVAQAAPAPMPLQRALGDYRSFTLPGAVGLPDGTVTLTPLYAARDVPCQRQYLLEAASVWQPPKPQTDDDRNDEYKDQPVASSLIFDAPDALPAGMLRAYIVDHDGASELLGDGNVPDTPKDKQVEVRLGESFDLRASRERSAFSVDQAARTMDEAYRVSLSNGGDVAHTVTVREHPNRWRAWMLVSSSVKPSKQTPDTLEFAVNVPAHGEVKLDYRVRYTWTAKDE